MRLTMKAWSWTWIWTLCSLLSLATLAAGSWGSPGSGQYHIQTDEGPERYFRFQTDNGQFRKEKRLQDGTVIGTEAWIDAAGFLRQKDYIADTKGYRILKSKTVFVGQGRPIEDAIKSTKAAPAQSGVLVDGSSGGVGVGANSIHQGAHKHGGYSYSTTPLPATTTTTTPRPRPTTSAAPAVERAFGYLSPAEAAKLEPSPYLGFDHYPDELPARHPPQRPLVHIRPHSQPLDSAYDEDEAPHDDFHHDDFHHSTTARPTVAGPTPSQPSLSIEPPLPSQRRRLRPIAVVSPTPAPIAGNALPSASPAPAFDRGYSTPAPAFDRGYSTPAPYAGGTSPAPTPGYFYSPQTPAGDVDGPSHERGGADHGIFATTARPTPAAAALPLDVNNLEGLQPPHLPTYYRRPRPQRPQSNSLDAGYGSPQDARYGSSQQDASYGSSQQDASYGTPQEAGNYDGVSTTRNGFRYFLPRQYHEEERVGGGRTAGSFGYVDPFGIRRVVYYNASPDRGFVHRNSNRYVGLDAPPYDPRPY